MNTTKESPAHKTKPQKSYESNPFKVVFNGFGNMYNINQNMTIVRMVVSVLGMFGSYGGNGGEVDGSSNLFQSMSPEVIAAIVAAVAVVLIVVFGIGIFLTTMYSGIASYVALKTAEGKTVTFKESFTATLKKFWTLFWINFVVFWKIFGGLLLFIVPGVRAMLRYNMVHMHVFDDNSSASEAIQKAKALTKGHLIEVFGVSTASGIIPFIGEAMLVGGQSVMYPQLKELKASGATPPKPHWLNYLAFIIGGGFILFFGLIVLIIAAIVQAS